MLRGSRAFSGKIHLPFLTQVVPPFIIRVSGGNNWRWKQERLKTRVCTISLRLQCIRGHQPPGPYHNTIQYKYYTLLSFSLVPSYSLNRAQSTQIEHWAIHIPRQNFRCQEHGYGFEFFSALYYISQGDHSENHPHKRNLITRHSYILISPYNITKFHSKLGSVRYAWQNFETPCNNSYITALHN